MIGRRLLQRHWRAPGWPGALALGLWALAAGVFFLLLQPVQMQLEAARAEAASRQETLRAQRAMASQGDTPDIQLVRFHQAFPADRQLPDLLDKMFAVAGSQGVKLNQGEYKITRNAAGRMSKCQVALPLRGSYAQLRKFIAALKAELPIVVLEQVQLKRQKVAEPLLDATIKLSFYLEPSP